METDDQEAYAQSRLSWLRKDARGNTVDDEKGGSHELLEEFLKDRRQLFRVCGEFLEMPGLRLTSQQARRLWGLDERTCAAVLDFLVDAKFLARPERDGAYSRLTDGSAQPPRLGDAATVPASADRVRGTA